MNSMEFIIDTVVIPDLLSILSLSLAGDMPLRILVFQNL